MTDKKCIIIVLVISIAGLGWSHPLASSYSKHCKKSYGRFPKEGSLCRSYYECQRWSAKERKCSGNDHFHPAKERCVRPEEYPCLEKPPTSDKCPRENGKFLKPGTKCRKYYDCCDGRPTKRECPGDTLFDPDRETCEYPELYRCVEDGNKESKKCPKQDGKFLKKGSGCKTFYDCRRGRANEKSCPSGQLFDRAREKCDWEELVTCIDDSDLTSKCLKPDGKYVKRGSKCRAYYDCQDGVATEKDCPEDQLFSVGRQMCDWEELVTCEDDGIPTEKPYRTTAGDSSEEETSESTTASEYSSTPSKYTTGSTREIFTDESSSSQWSTFPSTLSSQWTISSDQPSTDSVEITSSTTSDQTASETTSETPSSYQPTTESSTFLPTRMKSRMTEQSTTDRDEGSTQSQTSASSTHIPSELSTDVKEVTDEYTFEPSTSITAEVVSDISTRESSTTDNVQQPSTSLTQSSSDDYTGTSEEISTRIDLTSTLPTEEPRTTVTETSKDPGGKDGFETSTLEPVSLPSTTSVKTSSDPVSESSTVYSTFDYTLSSTWVTEQPDSTTESSSMSEDDGYTLPTSASSISDETSGLSSTWPPTVPTAASEDDGLDFSTLTQSTSDETSQSPSPTEFPTTSDESTASSSRDTLATGTGYPTTYSTSESEDDGYTLSTSASSISDKTNGLLSTLPPTIPTTASEDDGFGFSTSTRPTSDETSQSLSPTEFPKTSDESTASSSRDTLITGTEYPTTHSTSDSEDDASSWIPTDWWTTKTTNTLPPKTTTSKKVTDPGTGDLYCPEPDGHFPHPTNRHKFIACVGGRVFVMDCPADLVFVHELMRCEYDNQ